MQIKSNSTKELIKLIIFIGLIVMTLAVMIFLPRMSVPVLISYILYLILQPLMAKMIKLGFNKTASSFVILAGVLFFSTYPIIRVVPLITNEAENIQYYIPKIENYVKIEYSDIKKQVKRKIGFNLSDKYITDGIDKVRTSTSVMLVTLPNYLSRILEWFFVIPLLVFFMLKDFPTFKRKFISLSPNIYFEKFYLVSHQFNKQLGDYILAKFIEASILGFIITTGLFILDVRFALIFGLLAIVTNVIPYLGPLLGAAPALIFALAEYGASSQTGWIFGLYLVANAIDIAIIFPILVSKIVNLHPVVVVVSVILGSQFMGVVGMIVSIPVAAALKLVFVEFFGGIYSSNS